MFQTKQLTSVSRPDSLIGEHSGGFGPRLPGSQQSSSPEDPQLIPLSPNTAVEQVRLLDAHGAFLRLIGAIEAHTMIRERKAVGLGNRKHIQAVQLTVERQQVADAHNIPCRPLLPSGLVGQRYSHKHETQDNPAEVWTLRRVSADDRRTDLFIQLCHIASVTDCLGPVAKEELIAQLAVVRGLKRKDLD